MSKRKKYIDLKYKFIRFLLKDEKHQRKFNYLKAASEWTSRAIVSLELATGPIKSIKQAQQLDAIGGNTCEKLKLAINSGDVDPNPPQEGQYLSSGGALLVGLYDLTQKAKIDDPYDDNPLIGHSDLRQYAQTICEEKFLNPSSSFGAPHLCRAWWRINILEKRLFLKARTRDKEAVYHILPLGIEAAERLKGYTEKDNKAKIRATPLLTQDALYTTDDGRDGIVMFVDHRELGGDKHNLIKLSDLLAQQHVKFKTSALKMGDYSWIYRYNGVEKVLPIVVERKRADDLADSIKDGRFERQKNNMKQWKNEILHEVNEVTLIYILENDLQRYVVPCGHECVGKCGNPKLLNIMEIIGELEKDEVISLVYTANVEKTVEFLVSTTAELKASVENGEFDYLLAKPVNLKRKCSSSPKKAAIAKQKYVELPKTAIAKQKNVELRTTWDETPTEIYDPPENQLPTKEWYPSCTVSLTEEYGQSCTVSLTEEYGQSCTVSPTEEYGQSCTVSPTEEYGPIWIDMVDHKPCASSSLSNHYYVSSNSETSIDEYHNSSELKIEEDVKYSTKSFDSIDEISVQNHRLYSNQIASKEIIRIPADTSDDDELPSIYDNRSKSYSPVKAKVLFSDYFDELKSLKDIFPDHDEKKLKEVLSEQKGNVQLTVERILSLQ